MGRSKGEIRQSTGRVRRDEFRAAQLLLSHLTLITLGVVFILPFAWLVSTSLKPDSQVFVMPPRWIPNPFRWDNYPRALEYIPFFGYLKNTLTICFFNVFALLASSSLAAYGFSKIQWPGRNVLFVVMISTMMLPDQVTLIPVFLIFRKLHWIGTFKPLTVPALFGSAFSIFMLRQFYMTIPRELSDAARIDGCSEGQIFLRVVLPLAKPALTVVALFTFIGSWNDFMGPLIYLTDDRMYTLSLGLYSFQSAHSTEWTLLMAASTVMVLPIIILFFFTQRTFIQGIALTGVKG